MSPPVPGESPWVREVAHTSKAFARGVRVVVYTYEGVGKEIKLNDVVDFVGIFRAKIQSDNCSYIKGR